MHTDSFKHFLLEQSGRSKPITHEQAVQFIKQYCSQYWNSEQRIYRGVDNTSHFLMGDSSQSTRISGFVKANYYNQIFSNLEAWKDFPRRDRSFICSTSKKTAGYYGTTPYAVAVPDNTTIGIVPAMDIQVTRFSTDDISNLSPLSIHGFIDHFDAVLERDGYKFKTSPDRAQSDWHSLIKVLEEMASLIDQYANSELNTETVTFFRLLQQQGVERALNNIFDPKRAGFTTKQAHEVGTFPKDSEVWFSGQAVFVALGDPQSVIGDV